MQEGGITQGAKTSNGLLSCKQRWEVGSRGLQGVWARGWGKKLELAVGDAPCSLPRH